MRPGSLKWGYVRIITGTILGGILGFYVMHRVETNYKERMNERLRIYEAELKRKKEERLNEFEEPSNLVSIGVVGSPAFATYDQGYDVFLGKFVVWFFKNMPT